jgi:hypothetical protein
MRDLGDLQRALTAHGLTAGAARIGRDPDGQVRIPGPLAEQATRLLRAAGRQTSPDWARRLEERQRHGGEVTVEPMGAILLARALKQAAEQLTGDEADAAAQLAGNLDRVYAGEEDQAPALAALAVILLARGHDRAAVERAVAALGGQAWPPVAAALGMLEEAAWRHRADPEPGAPAGPEEPR